MPIERMSYDRPCRPSQQSARRAEALRPARQCHLCAVTHNRARWRRSRQVSRLGFEGSSRTSHRNRCRRKGWWIRNCKLAGRNVLRLGDRRTDGGPSTSVSSWSQVKRAGGRPRTKPSTTLKATRDSEFRNSFPSHVVTAWIVHDKRVAERHYLPLTNVHFA